MEEGKMVHERARQLFPEGVFAGKPERTTALLADKDDRPVFEAAFDTDGYIARADGLQRARDGYRLMEFKSGLYHEDELDEDYLDDLAYTVMVLCRAGLKIAKAELVLLSRDWRLDMPEQDLFVFQDCTEEAKKRAAEFDTQWDRVRDAVLGRKRPKAELHWPCRACPYFETDCVGKGVEDPLFDLPYLKEVRFNSLVECGCRSIRDIDSDVELSASQVRVHEAVRSAKPVIDQAAVKSLLDEVTWPAMYLDFETVTTAIPLWPGVSPREQVATQYSLHVCDRPGRVLKHSEYLADCTRDCRRELAERLLADTAGGGSVVHYSSFEKTMINGLASRLPDLAPGLKGLTARLFDLEAVFRKGYYHPSFRGRTSIKVTLPTLIPDMRYDTLDIGDGGAAVAAFARMVRGQCSPSEAQLLRKSLLEYCGQDTLAMVKLHEALAPLA
ncbi:MAG: DUF2779 domain-containing protein [Phycisphaerales bacterium]|nr:DUF2779 domain-containing protein [Phycisphaerales bacterium]